MKTLRTRMTYVVLILLSAVTMLMVQTLVSATTLSSVSHSKILRNFWIRSVQNHVEDSIKDIESRRGKTMALGFSKAEEVERKRRRRARNLLQADSSLNPINPSPIRIQTDFQIGSLPQPEQQHILDIVDHAVNRLEYTINVTRPVLGSLFLQKRCLSGWIWEQSGIQECGLYETQETCLEAKHRQNFFASTTVCTQLAPGDCNTIPGGDGASNKDFILYVTAKDTASCKVALRDESGNILVDESNNIIYENNLAQGGFCAIEDSTGRPVAGAINFCPDAIDITTNKPSEDVALHEIIHALVFNEELFGLFVDSNNELLGFDTVVKTLPSSMSYLATPNVVYQARKQSGCDTVVGGLLENDGGDGTELSHWESRHYKGEIMVGTIPNEGALVAFSNMTLAVFEDSGWYRPRYCQADTLLWQLDAGCDTYYADCSESPLPASLATSFCTTQGSSGCVWDYGAVGTCSSASLNSECLVYRPYSNLRCTLENFGSTEPSLGVNDPDGAFFWGQSYGEDSRCIPMIEGDTQKRLIRDGLSLTTYSRFNLGGGCFQISCDSSGGNVLLYVTIFDEVFACPSGQMVDISMQNGFLPGSQIGPCPAPESVCPTLGNYTKGLSNYARVATKSGEDDGDKKGWS